MSETLPLVLGEPSTSCADVMPFAPIYKLSLFISIINSAMSRLFEAGGGASHRKPPMTAHERSNKLCGHLGCAPKARVTCGGRFHLDNCRLAWKLTSGSVG